MKEITKSSIQLNLNYQLIHFSEFIHCITKESNNKNKKLKKISLSENIFA